MVQERQAGVFLIGVQFCCHAMFFSLGFCSL